MSRSPRPFVAGLGAILIVGFVVVWLMRVGPPETAAADEPFAPEPAPAPAALAPPPLPDLDRLPAYAEVDPSWTLRDLDGQTVSLQDLRGRVVLINFWATWCVPCIAEMPELEALAGSLEGAPVDVLLVSDEPLDDIYAFLSQHGGDLPVYRADGPAPPALQSYGLPTTFVLDPDGAIVFKYVGAAAWNHPSVAAFIRDILARK